MTLNHFRAVQLKEGNFKLLSTLLALLLVSLNCAQCMARDKADNVRLPQTVIPLSYKIYIEPDLKNKQFSGRETIYLKVNKSVDKIILNVNDLEIAEPEISQVKDNHGKWLSPESKIDKKNERLILTLKKKLRPGNHELRLKFAGSLDNKLVGFYYSSFKNKEGKVVPIATTQMEPTDARRVFPCFDEPDLKATFKISLAVDPHLQAISNSPIKFIGDDKRGGKKIFHFEETPKMSTYLVALVVGPFEATEPITVNGVKVRIWATRGKKKQCLYARNLVKELLPYFEDYFGVKYPTPKLDLIAIPDFGPGAMENLGAITFRETRLLVDDKTTSTKTKQSVASVVAHEMAHMWFGDLVTMKWWDDLWLNEAFATWMSVKAVDHIKPEWKPWDSFIDERDYALDTDALVATRPIYAPVKHPSEAEAMFDEITYEKGASVLRMLEKYLGEDDYKKGIQEYISKFKFDNARGADLWKALGNASKKPVSKIMEDWIHSPGYPLVKIEEAGSKFKISQQRFYLLKEQKSKTNWQIPVTFRYLKDKSTESILLKGKNSSIKLDGSKKPILVNANANGYYRVNYSKANLEAIQSSIQSLNARERFQILSDSWAMVESSNLPIQSYLDLTKSFKNDMDPTVIGLLIDQIQHIDRFIDLKDKDKYAKFVRDRLGPINEELGWDAKPKESDLDQLLRSKVLSAMGTLGQDKAVIEEARKRFEIYTSYPEKLNPNLYDAIVSVVSYNGDARDYAALESCFRKAPSPEAKDRNLIALGNFRNASLQDRTLKLSLSSEVKTQDAPHLVRHILETKAGRYRGWKFVKSNWKSMESRFPVHLFPRVIKGTKSFVTQEDFQDLAQFLKVHPVKSGDRVVKKVLETVRVNTGVNRRCSEPLTEWLNNF